MMAEGELARYGEKPLVPIFDDNTGRVRARVKELEAAGLLRPADSAERGKRESALAAGPCEGRWPDPGRESASARLAQGFDKRKNTGGLLGLSVMTNGLVVPLPAGVQVLAMPA